MEAVAHILKKQFPHIHGLQSTFLAPTYKEGEGWSYEATFQLATIFPNIQIHHTGNIHCVASLKTSANAPVIIFDSLRSPSGNIAPSVKLQSSKLYGPDKSFLNASIPKIKRQTNLVDCGLYAICHLVQFCFDGWAGKSVLKFDQGKMIPHLIQCLSEKIFQPFPTIPDRVTNAEIIDASFILYCCCSFSKCYDNLIKCDRKTCGRWVFIKCRNRQQSKETTNKKYFCFPCTSWYDCRGYVT